MFMLREPDSVGWRLEMNVVQTEILYNSWKPEMSIAQNSINYILQSHLPRCLLSGVIFPPRYQNHCVPEPVPRNQLP